MSVFKRFFDRLIETDEARLKNEVREWAATVPGSVPIAAARLRQRVKIAGQIRRLTVFPMKDNESLEAHVSDGTGEVVVRFMGRRAIPGLGLGSKIVVEGVLGGTPDAPTMLNPLLEFTA